MGSSIFYFMYLEKLEIQGFKSFANHTELVFNRDLTAIVGPNGSGKSNIADSVRWVLGEQSSKTLRGKKSEDVIFAGSDKKNKLGFARVDLFLNNLDHSADIDYEQVIVTRKINRNGESEYLVNNNKVRLLDVQLLLAKANFGQKTYSVIGQGMIDSILTSSSAERKEFFDEATGVKQFQIKKEQAINKLTHAKDNLSQTGQILAELEPRLKSLTRQVKRLEKREKLEIELLALQTDYYSFLSNHLNKDLNQTRVRFNKAQTEVSDLNQKLIALQTQLEKEEKSSSRQDNFELLQNKLSHLQNELNTFLKEKTILEGQADLKLISKGRSDLVWLKKHIENIKNDINKNSLVLEEKQVKLKQADQEVDLLEDKRSKILNEFKELEERLVDSNTNVSPEELSTKLSSICKQQQSFQQSLNTLKSLEDVSKLKEICASITSALSELWNKLSKSKDNDQEHWQAEFNKLLTTKDTLVSEINEARTKTALLKQDLETLSNQIKKDKVDLGKLESEKQALAGEVKSNVDSQDLNDRIIKKNKEIAEIENEIRAFNTQEEKKKSILVEAQKNFRTIQHNFNTKNNELNEVKIDLARLETKQEDLNTEIAEEIPDLKIKDVNSLNTEEAKQKINSCQNQLNVIGGIDETIVGEYQEVNTRYSFLKEQTDDLNKAISQLEKLIKDLDDSISSQFDKSFHNINKLFDKNFKKLFNGGKSELILNITENKLAEKKENDDEEEEEQLTKTYGIDIKAIPPGKKLANINMLSGGEKALTSIALICAIIGNNPSPFVVLDEVDAALDEANSVRFTDILVELASKTQFIAITHNRATMHKAKIIYGTTMGSDGVSKLLSLSFSEADEIAA